MSIDTSGLMDSHPIGPLDRSFLLVIMEFCVLHPKRGGSGVWLEEVLLEVCIMISSIDVLSSLWVYHASLSTFQRHLW